MTVMGAPRWKAVLNFGSIGCFFTGPSETKRNDLRTKAEIASCQKSNRRTKEQWELNWTETSDSLNVRGARGRTFYSRNNWTNGPIYYVCIHITYTGVCVCVHEHVCSKIFAGKICWIAFQFLTLRGPWPKMYKCQIFAVGWKIIHDKTTTAFIL